MPRNAGKKKSTEHDELFVDPIPDGTKGVSPSGIQFIVHPDAPILKTVEWNVNGKPKKQVKLCDGYRVEFPPNKLHRYPVMGIKVWTAAELNKYGGVRHVEETETTTRRRRRKIDESKIANIEAAAKAESNNAK